jgi:hypothetical protein
MMTRYPTLDRTVAVDLAEQMVRQISVSVDDKAIWRGSGKDIDLRGLDSALARSREELINATEPWDEESFEGRLSAVVHAELLHADPEVLDDPGFWRYLAVSRFWWFISWRESGPISRGNLATYIDGRHSAESIPVRLFVRGQATLHDGSYSRASALERSADFWRSHVLRVRVGSSPQLTQALVDLQLQHRMNTDELRALARLLNRSWSNIVLHLYDHESCRSFLEELLAKVKVMDAEQG